MDSKAKQTTITFHNGMTTIGGTLIEVSTAKARVFFDFGSVFDPNLDPQPTTLQELLDHNLISYVDALYDPRLPLSGYADPCPASKDTIICVCHVHLDHTKILNYADPTIPVYLSQASKDLLIALNQNNDFLFPSPYLESPTRTLIGVEDNQSITCQDINVRFVPIDHDAYGANGFIITTPDMKIAYTGDFRFHGLHPEKTLDFAEQAHYSDVMIMEGVQISFMLPGEESVLFEQDVIDAIIAVQKENPHRQITFDYYEANLDRVIALIENSPRTVVLNQYCAAILKQVAHYPVHFYRESQEALLLDKSLEIPLSDLMDDSSAYFWQVSRAHIPNMKEGGIYIHTDASPLGEYDNAYQPYIDSFVNHGIEFRRMTTSGHAYPSDLFKMIDLVQPHVLVPLHSFKPERLTNAYGDRLLPKKKETL